MNLPKSFVRSAGIAAVATAATASVLTAGPAHASPHAPAAGVASHTLTIIGTAENDTMTASFSADGRTVQVDLGDRYPSRTFYRRDFNRIAVFLRAGDDEFRVVPAAALTSSSAAVTNTPVTVDGGTGDDFVLGGSGDDVLYGGDGDDTLQGGAGTDREYLGSGSDTAVWFPGEGSDLVRGGAGKDHLHFVGANAAEVYSLTAYGQRAVLNRDLGGIRMDLDEVEALDLDTLGGADHVSVGNLDGTALHAANVDLGAAENLVGSRIGDDSADAVTVAGTYDRDYVDVRARQGAVEVSGLPVTTTIYGSEQADALQIRTLAGYDRVLVHRGVSNLITTSVNLGSQ